MTNEPLKHALDMANALLRLLSDLQNDDPGDDERHVAPRLTRAQQQAQELFNTLKEIAR